MTSKPLESNDEWRKELPADLYRVARERGTEPPFTGKYVDEKREGTYMCACCGAPLFESATKFDSGTGWPSFTAPAAAGNVARHEDRSHGMLRTEVTCMTCGAHLGHVFPDGPGPEGNRYCINSCSLDLKKKPGE
ncbi:MAG: peptide-methionine (R)-S-oxide reductase MsrB [Alphaproteobacteria bacterium]